MVRPTKYVSRSDLKWGPSPAGAATPRSGLVVHYDSADQGLAGKAHSACLTYWRNTRSFHTGPSRGWADVGYSFMACAHGYVIEGRGLRRYQAAQGTTAGNSNYYSVTLATGPNDRITDAQINAVRELRQWLTQDHGNAGTVLGHRDFVSTSCPGDKAYALVRNGTFAQPPGASTEGNDLLGLKKGDSGDAVKLLQIKLKRIGGEVAEALKYPGGPADGVDSDYGTATAEAVRLARKRMGSAAKPGYGDRMSPDAVEQVDRAYAQRQAETVLGSQGGGNCECGDCDGSLPTTENVTFTGVLERS